MIGAGAGGGGAMDAADILKPALARGQVRCIGATTTAEYQKYIEQDPALARRFQPLRLDEPTPADAPGAGAPPVNMEALKGFFAPELLNRIDEIVTFRPLDRASVRRILDKYLDGLRAQLAGRGMSLAVSPEAYDLMAADGFSAEFGARHLSRVVERSLVRPLAAHLLAGGARDGATVRVTDEGGRVAIAIV